MTLSSKLASNKLPVLLYAVIDNNSVSKSVATIVKKELVDNIQGMVQIGNIFSDPSDFTKTLKSYLDGIDQDIKEDNESIKGNASLSMILTDGDLLYLINIGNTHGALINNNEVILKTSSTDIAFGDFKGKTKKVVTSINHMYLDQKEKYSFILSDDKTWKKQFKKITSFRL
jgi:serine/threonine protein phosphatase PrpC